MYVGLLNIQSHDLGPQANKTVLATDVTFAGNVTSASDLELSRITVLSPPSALHGEEGRSRTSRSSRSKGEPADETDAVSFR